MTISFEGSVGQLFKPDGKGRLSARTWLGKLNLSTMYGSLPTRMLPLEIDYPWTQTYAVTYVLPAGASAVGALGTEGREPLRLRFQAGQGGGEPHHRDRLRGAHGAPGGAF